MEGEGLFVVGSKLQQGLPRNPKLQIVIAWLQFKKLTLSTLRNQSNFLFQAKGNATITFLIMATVFIRLSSNNRSFLLQQLGNPVHQSGFDVLDKCVVHFRKATDYYGLLKQTPNYILIMDFCARLLQAEITLLYVTVTACGVKYQLMKMKVSEQCSKITNLNATK